MRCGASVCAPEQLCPSCQGPVCATRPNDSRTISCECADLIRGNGSAHTITLCNLHMKRFYWTLMELISNALIRAPMYIFGKCSHVAIVAVRWHRWQLRCCCRLLLASTEQCFVFACHSNRDRTFCAFAIGAIFVCHIQAIAFVSEYSDWIYCVKEKHKNEKMQEGAP